MLFVVDLSISVSLEMVVNTFLTIMLLVLWLMFWVIGRCCNDRTHRILKPASSYQI